MSTPPRPQLPLPTSWWYILLALALGILLIYALSVVRFHLRAPLALNIPVRSCYLSPGGDYIHITTGNDSDKDTQIYRLADGKHIDIAIQEPIRHIYSNFVWIGNEQFFYTGDWEQLSEKEYDTPTDGWVINIDTQTVTDTRTFDPEMRKTILERAKQIRNDLRSKKPLDPLPSPDGNYIFKPVSITDRQTGRVLNQVYLTDPYRMIACEAGWRPDSGGYYFIDLPYWTLQNKPGPIRLLLTHPPVP